MLRCSPVTTNLGSPGSCPCRFTSTPSSTTPVSSSRLTTPVARLVYQSAVLPVIPFISHPSSGSLLWEEHDRPGAALPLAYLSIGSECSGLPKSDPAGGGKECIRYTYESANVAASHRRCWCPVLVLSAGSQCWFSVLVLSAGSQASGVPSPVEVACPRSQRRLRAGGTAWAACSWTSGRFGGTGVSGGCGPASWCPRLAASSRWSPSPTRRTG